MSDSPPEARLVYDFKNVRPIELLDLTASLLAIGEQYKSFIRRQGGPWADDDYRLYVKEVRTGSIVAELISQAVQGQMIAPFAPFIIQFTQQLGDWFEFFKGVKDAKDIKELFKGATKKDFQQVSQIVEPVAKDGGSQINLVASQGGVIVVNAPLTLVEANAVQNGLRRRIEAIPETLSGVHRDQVLYWYQVRADLAEKPGDKAVIERFSKWPVKVRFYSDDVKRAMLDREENPFRKLYVVDVDVTELDGKPVLYRVSRSKTPSTERKRSWMASERYSWKLGPASRLDPRLPRSVTGGFGVGPHGS